jgi:hypothetical protein
MTNGKDKKVIGDVKKQAGNSFSVIIKRPKTFDFRRFSASL